MRIPLSRKRGSPLREVVMAAPSSMMDMLLSLQEAGKRLVDAGELYNAFQALFGADTNVVGAAAAPGPVLSTFFNLVTSGAEVTLPPAIPGKQVQVLVGPTAGADVTVNTTQSNPANGGAADQIAAVGAWANVAPVTVAQGAPTLFVCYELGHWLEVPL